MKKYTIDKQKVYLEGGRKKFCDDNKISIATWDNWINKGISYNLIKKKGLHLFINEKQEFMKDAALDISISNQMLFDIESEMKGEL